MIRGECHHTQLAPLQAYHFSKVGRAFAIDIQRILSTPQQIPVKEKIKDLPWVKCIITVQIWKNNKMSIYSIPYLLLLLSEACLFKSTEDNIPSGPQDAKMT